MLWQDSKYSFRTVQRSPGFALLSFVGALRKE